ncbi:MAG: ATP-binding protein, partial [Acidobacteriota bacterium]|nr:ATP-binding protein [Acidobacteriota bacterium]
KTLAERKEILETISAFANSKGGKIFIGIEENKDGYVKKIIGIKIKGREIENLSNEIKQNTDSVIYPSIEVKKIEGKSVLVVEVKESLIKPIFAKIDKIPVAFKRVGKTNQKIDVNELRRIISEGKEFLWDSQVCERATLDDVNEEKIRWFLRKAKHERGLDIEEDTSVDEVLLRLKLLDNKKPTNAAVLLFGKDPQRFFIQSEVKGIRFKGVDVTGEMIDLRVIEGNVLDQLTETEKFIFNNIAMAAWIEEGKIERQERWEYPPKAIREALANTMCHRDYKTTSKIQVRIFDDRIEFWNPGRLPDGWTVETLKQKHESMPPNPSITKQFFWIKYIEEVGTGTNKIIEWCRDWNLPEPDFEFTGTSLIVTLWKSKLTDRYLDSLGLNERQRKAINYMKEHKRITSKKYAELFSITDRTARNDLNSLVNKGVLIQKGTSKKLTYYELSV